MSAPPLWAASIGQALAAAVATERGLSSAEAAARLQTLGPNELAPPRRFEGLRELLRYFANPLVLILLVASVVSAAFGQPVSARDHRADARAERGAQLHPGVPLAAGGRALRRQVAPDRDGVRDGVEREVPVREVVPGDVIHLKAGDLVPADGRLLHDPGPVRQRGRAHRRVAARARSRRPRCAGAARARRGGTAVFRGTSVVSGVGAAVVVATGPATAVRAGSPRPRRAATGDRVRAGHPAVRVPDHAASSLLVLFVFLVNALLRRDPLESFLFALALAVGLTPEFLPMIVDGHAGQRGACGWRGRR